MRCYYVVKCQRKLLSSLKGKSLDPSRLRGHLHHRELPLRVLRLHLHRFPEALLLRLRQPRPRKQRSLLRRSLRKLRRRSLLAKLRMQVLSVELLNVLSLRIYGLRIKLTTLASSLLRELTSQKRTYYVGGSKSFRKIRHSPAVERNLGVT